MEGRDQGTRRGHRLESGRRMPWAPQTVRFSLFLSPGRGSLSAHKHSLPRPAKNLQKDSKPYVFLLFWSPGRIPWKGIRKKLRIIQDVWSRYVTRQNAIRQVEKTSNYAHVSLVFATLPCRVRKVLSRVVPCHVSQSDILNYINIEIGFEIGNELCFSGGKGSCRYSKRYISL